MQTVKCLDRDMKTALWDTRERNAERWLKDMRNLQRGRNFSDGFCSANRACLVAQLVKHLPAMRETSFDLWVGKILWRRERLPPPAFLPGESHGQRRWWATVYGVAKSQTRLGSFHFTCSVNRSSSISPFLPFPLHPSFFSFPPSFLSFSSRLLYHPFHSSPRHPILLTYFVPGRL